MKSWWIYRGQGSAQERRDLLRTLEAPPWRAFDGVVDPLYQPPGPHGPAWARTLQRSAGYVSDESETDAVNTALYLRRPLLVTGRPGVGKSTLASDIAADLALGPVLHWPITSRSTRRDGLYLYDAISRLQDANLERMRTPRRAPGNPKDPHRQSIEPYLTLGPLGTALIAQDLPRVLLIDEIDKSDLDLAGDLLTLFEDGAFEIPELARIAAAHRSIRIPTGDGPEHGVTVEAGRIQCRAFPIVIMTSNGDRDFPAPFLRRCVQLKMEQPSEEKLKQIVRHRLGIDVDTEPQYRDLIESFLSRNSAGDLATDQLLNAIQLRVGGAWSDQADQQRFLDLVMHPLTGREQV